MLYAHSNVSRRIVGRFDRGEDLMDALVALCEENEIKAGQVRAQGLLSQVDLGLFSADRAEYVTAFRATGSFALLSLDGSVSMLGSERVINAHAMIAYPAHGQSHVVGGQLRSAAVYTVEFVIDVFDDLELQRALDPDTRLPLWKTVVQVGPDVAASALTPKVRPEARPQPPTAPAVPPPRKAPQPAVPSPVERVEAEAPAADLAGPEPPPPRPGGASEAEWQRAARQSQAFLSEEVADDERGELDEEVELEVGDILLHPRLGECTVVKVEDDVAAYIRIKRSKRVSKLALSVVRLVPLEDRAGTRVFRVLAGST